MAKIYVANAFSLNMVPNFVGKLDIQSGVSAVGILDSLYMSDKFQLDNCIGHQDTDAVVRDILFQDGISIPCGERKSVSLEQGDILLVAQYSGPRLPEGTTRLPEGSKITWITVQIVP